ncbi:uncharacterized protein LOC108669135 [Hyalella azteca]|uniref:Uncharacterized protein LOC108669135 n=1 Tax=Hyalella azteca TaxID=294128 RepID=A0A979FJ34_HYAAZ|nr:uncharacterized protein LOC108669135 [Hyalella azteca]
MSFDSTFVTEILRWRYAAALASVLLVQVVLPSFACGIFKTFFVLQVWHPVTVVQELWQSSWISGLFLPTLCYLILVRVHVHNYSVVEDHSTKVWHVCHKALRLKSLCVTAVLVSCISYLTHHYAAAAHPLFASLVLPCSSSGSAATCMNSRALLAWCLGVVCGLHYAFVYILGGGNLVTMATIPAPKKQRLRALLAPSALGRRMHAAFWGDGENEPHLAGIGIRGVMSLVICYAFIGGMLESWVGNVLGINPSSELPHADALTSDFNSTDNIPALKQELALNCDI